MCLIVLQGCILIVRGPKVQVENAVGLKRKSFELLFEKMCRSKLGNPLNLLIHWQVINWLFQARNRILVFRILLHCGYRKKNKVFACSSFAAA